MWKIFCKRIKRDKIKIKEEEFQLNRTDWTDFGFDRNLVHLGFGPKFGLGHIGLNLG